MDLKKLPPSMLVLLGLGSPGMQACCLSPALPLPSETTAADTTTGPFDTTESDVGPCLSPPEETFSADTSTGTGTGSTGTGTDTDTGTGTGSTGTGSNGSTDDGASGEGSTTFVPCLGVGPSESEQDRPPDDLVPTHAAGVARSRREALEWVLHSLPPDVAERLRKTIR